MENNIYNMIYIIFCFNFQNFCGLVYVNFFLFLFQHILSFFIRLFHLRSILHLSTSYNTNTISIIF